ncbi:hypothetical protein CVO77_12360 [Sphingopyxis lindanitolerans]|uniref:Competence protein n=1 Tax=Sphingopyxis lindanitolerans TaxID=2054227 RepID=A0A2S8B0I3_9SPHN|nr:hypothetical protein CVO77_12360 [Sphingopyxis lindanitolerans]
MLDLDTGEFMESRGFITSFLYQELVKERGIILGRMHRDEPRFVCADCMVPVYLVSRPEEHIFFFRHRHEDGSCPARTRSPLSEEEIRARKYHGLRESEPHKQLKAMLLRCLDADPSFSDIATEQHWKSSTREKAYRRPDVQAEDSSGKIAFEVQLSTTFLRVVVGRRDFYREESALLIWLFRGFDPSYRLMTTDDLLFPNNSNLFVIDDETVRISLEREQLHFRCHFRRPIRSGYEVTDRFESEIVAFSTLTQDRDGQRAFYFDYDGAEAEIRVAIAADRAEAEAAAEEQRLAEIARLEAEAARRRGELDANDRKDFFEFWLEYGGTFRHTSESRGAWLGLRGRFAWRAIPLPEYPDTSAEVRAMVSALYSAREGKPVGWNYDKLVQVAHLLAQSHPRLILAFGYALEIHQRMPQIEREDVSGKWLNRKWDIGARLKIRDEALLPDPELFPLMRFLFPEVAERVEGYFERATRSDGSS